MNKNNNNRSTPFVLEVRKDLRFNFENVPGIHTADNLYISHFFNALSVITPVTEGVLIRAIRKAQPEITGTQFEADAKAFIGQEAIHTREHRALNQRLADLGYDMREVLHKIDDEVEKIENEMSLQEALAFVVTGEHAIYSIARTLLNIPHADYDQHTEVRKLFSWHALEEMEHQSVCDDIYTHLYGKGISQKFVYYRIFAKAANFLGRKITRLMNELIEQDREPKPGELQQFLKWMVSSPAVGSKTMLELMGFFSPLFSHWQRETEDRLLIDENLKFVYSA
jgi:uncharacterized protein